MFIYLSTTLIAAALAIAYAAQPPFRASRRLSLYLFGLAIFIFVGFRDNVGTDWSRYLDIYHYISAARLFRSTIHTDIGFYLINWVAAALSVGFYGVTAFCAAVLAWGLISFAKQTPYPWISITIAMPHVVNVMAMDHIRQSTALGFALFAMSNMLRGRPLMYVLFIIVASLFHKSAIILLPLAFVSSNRKRSLIYLSAVVFIASFYYLVLADAATVYEDRYISQEYEARGSLIRLLQNVPPAVIYITMWRRFKLRSEVMYFWMIIAVFALLLPVLLFIVPSSAAIDRLGKLIIPLQMFVYSYMIVVFKHEVLYRAYIVAALGLYCILVQTVWFYYSDIAHDFWLPYRTVLF